MKIYKLDVFKPIKPILRLTRHITNSSVTLRLLSGPGLVTGEVWYFICLSLFLFQYLSFSASGLITFTTMLKHPNVGICDVLSRDLSIRETTWRSTRSTFFIQSMCVHVITNTVNAQGNRNISTQESTD